MKETTLYVFTDTTGSQYLGNILFQDWNCTKFVDSGQKSSVFSYYKAWTGATEMAKPALKIL